MKVLGVHRADPEFVVWMPAMSEPMSKLLLRAVCWPAGRPPIFEGCVSDVNPLPLEAIGLGRYGVQSPLLQYDEMLVKLVLAKKVK